MRSSVSNVFDPGVLTSRRSSPFVASAGDVTATWPPMPASIVEGTARSFVTGSRPGNVPSSQSLGFLWSKDPRELVLPLSACMIAIEKSSSSSRREVSISASTVQVEPDR